MVCRLARIRTHPREGPSPSSAGTPLATSLARFTAGFTLLPPLLSGGAVLPFVGLTPRAARPAGSTALCLARDGAGGLRGAGHLNAARRRRAGLAWCSRPRAIAGWTRAVLDAQAQPGPLESLRAGAWSRLQHFTLAEVTWRYLGASRGVLAFSLAIADASPGSFVRHDGGATAGAAILVTDGVAGAARCG